MKTLYHFATFCILFHQKNQLVFLYKIPQQKIGIEEIT
ncbi:hypothetical protein RU96_GL000394 [Enterococcus canintestini]|uniref:Uncharacterized protein n=1 Tax=Enterococcus canintestini TaxID=317010 RepID=A0A1L8R5H3_9ENTE|nr:hypothetical protein RU96_GL000394 [Enterococcus canintestini]